LSCSTEKSNKSGGESGLIWSDEFNKPGLPDESKWKYDVGRGCNNGSGCGWGNNELQCYTKKDPQNARIEDGKLIIEAHRHPEGQYEYTSARLKTRGTMDQKYGRFEIRAKLPQGRGTWPAIWLLPSDRKPGERWPRIGEIDIMEHVGYHQGWIVGTIHTESFNWMKGTQKVDSIYIEHAHEEFHTYAIEWTENKIEWFVDGVSYHSVKKTSDNVAEWPFDKRFYLILNIAVGGNWGGKMGVDESIWPARMVIDYIRIYEMKS